jgi:hypothetical protein
MAIAQEVTVFVDDATLAALKELDYTLYALKGFETTNAQGKAMAWGETSNYLQNTTFISTAEYQAFLSAADVLVGNGIVIHAGTSADVVLGDIVTFTDLNTPLKVTPGGYAQGVTIVNASTTPYSAGLSARSMDAGGTFSPVAGVPLYGLSEAIIAPVDKFLVTFSTSGTQVGQPLPYSMTQSLLIDMTGQTQLEATFDINTGWSFNNASWGQTIPAGADLFAVLVKETPLMPEV